MQEFLLLVWQVKVGNPKRENQTGFRAALFARDKGVCRACGRNCERLENEINTSAISNPVRCLELQLLNPGLEPWATYWQADHIQPVHLGGKSDLKNGQTLCLPCHSAKTKYQAANGRQRSFVPTPLYSQEELLSAGVKI